MERPIQNKTAYSCVVCGRSKYIEFEYEDLFEVCSNCACKIANFYNKQHSGKWLTYENEKSITQKQRIPNKLRWIVFSRDGYKCKKCGNTQDLSVDHIFPESLGGNLELNNLQTLCRSCNSRKKNKYDKEPRGLDGVVTNYMDSKGL